MELFHFDIEVAGTYPDFKSFKSVDERGAKLFEDKYKKMWIDKYSLEQAYLEQSPIISTYGRICCISFGFIGNDGQKTIRSFHGTDEKDIVNKFNDILKRIEVKDFKVAGFRIFYFDIPWLLHKLHKYQIEPASILYTYDKKPWGMRIVDIAEDWKGKFAWTASFDEVCYELGVKSPKENISGKDVHKYFWEGKLEEIKNYCEMDVSSSMDVSKLIYK